ncbi:MAG: hypothetical protein VW665_09415, partial [Candidatus Puniceispirillum sp.]
MASLAAPAHSATSESVKILPIAFTPMEPVVHTAPILPKMRTDPALAYPAQTVDIPLPLSKPKLEDVLPVSTVTVGEMIRLQTGLESHDETSLTLRSGEGIGAVLRRAGYHNTDIANAVEAISGKVNLRRLQIGTRFQIADHGFRLSVKPGRDIYVLNDPEGGWVALS